MTACISCRPSNPVMLARPGPILKCHASLPCITELLSAGIERVRREFERAQHSDPPCQQLHARRILVDGSNNVHSVDSMDEGKAISAIQVRCCGARVGSINALHMGGQAWGRL